MKKYQPCEVKIRKVDEHDVILLSQAVNGVTEDTFANENWWQGEESL